MVSKKVYQDRLARGVCVRCGEAKQESATKQCVICVTKAKAKRGVDKPPPAEPAPVAEMEIPVDSEQVIEIYGGKCAACCDGEKSLLRLVPENLNSPEKKTFRQLLEYLTRRAALTGKWPSGYEVMCASCFRERAIAHAIKLEDLV